MPGEKMLTPKQHSFVLAYLELGNATEAYRRCYKASNNQKTNERNAHKLVHNPKVISEIAKLRMPRNKAISRTIEDSIKEQEKAMEMAEATGSVAAYAAASMNKAKLLGYLVERQDVRQLIISHNDVMPDLGAIWARVTSEDAEVKLITN